MQTINGVPQCENCPLLDLCYPPLPSTRFEPGEEGGYICKVDSEFIPCSMAPPEGMCDRLAGYASAPPHPLDVALARRDWAGAAEWLTEHVSAEVLRKARPGMSAGSVYDWNALHPRADGRVENFSSYHTSL